MKKIILLLGLLLLLSGCNEVERVELIDMDCDNLQNKMSERPYGIIRDNELYQANAREIFKLKKCIFIEIN